MIVNVNFFKATPGKWYAGGKVDIGDARLWRDHNFHNEVAEAIGEKQEILRKGALSGGDFITVVTQPDDDEGDEFCQALFWAGDFPPGT